MASFIEIDGTYVNLYDEESNIMLHPGDECYFLLFNVDDIHIPLICSGNILEDSFLDGMNKQYIIQMNSICESPDVIDKYFDGKIFKMCNKTKSDGFSTGKPLMIYSSNFQRLIQENFVRVDAVFVRKNYQLAASLKKEFLEIIKTDLMKQILEVDDMLTK